MAKRILLVIFFEMTLDIGAIAETKAGGIQSQKIAWTQTLNRLQQLKLDDAVSKQLIDATGGVHALDCFCQLAERDVRESGESSVTWEAAFFQAVDESDYALADWLAALQVLGNWFSERNRQSSLSKVIGYISCGEEAAHTVGSRLPLETVVADMLERYGYEG